MFFGVNAYVILVILLPSFVHVLIVLNGFFVSQKNMKSAQIGSVTIVIPTRDEEILIERKLENLVEMCKEGYVDNVRFYDCSSDRTSEIIRDFIKNRDVSEVWEIIENCEVGKSKSISRAIREIKSDIMIITDADAYVDSASFSQLLNSLKKRDVMAACGIDVGDKSLYRFFSNWVRLSESNIGATVVFEGSICGFKMSHLDSDSIDVNRNADDSQLAVSVQRTGGRAVYVKECVFRDLNGVVNSRGRQIRRSQGLLRHLYRELMNSDNSIRIRVVAGLNLHLFTIMPIGLLLAFLTVTANVTGMVDGPIFPGSDSRILFLFLAAVIIVIANGAFSVYTAIILFLSGRDLAVWKPLRESN